MVTEDRVREIVLEEIAAHDSQVADRLSRAMRAPLRLSVGAHELETRIRRLERDADRDDHQGGDA